MKIIKKKEECRLQWPTILFNFKTTRRGVQCGEPKMYLDVCLFTACIEKKYSSERRCMPCMLENAERVNCMLTFVSNQSYP